MMEGKENAMGKMKGTIVENPDAWDEIAQAEYAEWCEEEEIEQVNFELQEIANAAD